MASTSLFAALAQLTAIDGPSGFEEPVLSHCRDLFKPLCDEVVFDLRGNLYAKQHGSRPQAPTVMVMTHADEIGLQITGVDDNGFLRFTKIGGITDSVLPGARLRVLADRQAIEGVVGVRPGHLLTAAEARQTPLIKDMYIDVGADSPQQVASMGIEAGRPAVLASPLVLTQDGRRVFGKAVDDRAGILVQYKFAEHSRKHPMPCNLVLVVTVEEEIGLRGAEVASRRVSPDVVIAIDTVPAGGTPDVAQNDLAWKIGEGPLIKVRETKGLATHGPLRDHFVGVAQQHNIPVQLIVDTAGITDATAAQQASGDVAALTLGLARRYAHSGVEMLDLADVDNLIKLLAFGVAGLTDTEMLMRMP